MKRLSPVATTLLLFVISTLFALVGPSSALAQTDEAAADAVIQAWISAFNEPNLEKITALYDTPATLWGTTLTVPATTPEAIRRYFTPAPPAAGAAPATPLKGSLGERTTRVFGDIAIITGIYMVSRDTTTIPLRFSFVLQRKDNKWMIVHHHSSAMPAQR